MEFDNLTEPFTDEQKINSFLYLQDFILNKIIKNEKFFIGRLSGNETRLCGKMLKGEVIPYDLTNRMLFDAGIQMTSLEDFKTYVKLYTDACKNSSILSIWSGTMYTQAKEYYEFLSKIYPDKKKICAQALEPYYFMNNNNYKYNDIFIGKKVLVITGHKETTLQQLKKKKNIYEKPIFDETTEIDIYKPVQQHCGNHDDKSWRYHLDRMQEDLMKLYKKKQYDIALVSCGGFGMIICDYIYSKLNKSVIYVGGSLQLYFGIIGNRWKQHQILSKLINENWVSVLDADKPKTLSLNPNICENNCYW